MLFTYENDIARDLMVRDNSILVIDVKGMLCNIWTVEWELPHIPLSLYALILYSCEFNDRSRLILNSEIFKYMVMCFRMKR